MVSVATLYIPVSTFSSVYGMRLGGCGGLCIFKSLKVFLVISGDQQQVAGRLKSDLVILSDMLNQKHWDLKKKLFTDEQGNDRLIVTWTNS